MAYNGIQARANDAKIKTAAAQIEKAMQLFYLDTGNTLASGSQSTGPVTNNACPGSSVASGWAGKLAYSCTLEDLLVSDKQLSADFFASLPPNNGYTRYTFMLYQCSPSSDNRYAMYWYLQSPSTADLDSLTNVTTSSVCGGQSYTNRYNNGMRAGKVVQL